MPFGLLKRRRFKHRLIRAILISLLCVLLGLISTLWQAASNLQRTTNIRMTNARQLVERTLDSARKASLDVKEYHGKPCLEPVELQLRMQVAYSQNLRSINLVRGHKIYCSSLYGNNEENINFDSYTNGMLYLMSDTRVRKGQPLIIYRMVVGHDSIVVRLYGDHILSELNVMSINLPLALVVGRQQWQTSAAPLFTSDMPGYMEQISSRYPFRIATVISSGDYAYYFWIFSRFTLLSWFLLAAIVGFGVFRWSGRLITVEYELLQALNLQEFIPYFQPVVSGEHSQWVGCEVLIRWSHPNLGIIPPDSFIPLAESCNLIIPMTQTLMTNVCKQFVPIAHLLPKNFHFAFNISASQFSDFNLVEDCRKFIQAFRDNPVRLVLELTERELLVTNSTTQTLVKKLHKLGVLIAIDDFGTGNSSLKYLQSFNVDILKIDKSFVNNIGVDSYSVHIIDNIIDLANRLDLQIVAEGVENEVQATYLKARNVSFLQGYLYGKPIPMEDFARQFYS